MANYSFHPSHHIIKDFSEFSGLPVGEIETYINDFERLSAAEWNALPAQGYEARAEVFYGTSDYYIYDLLSANYSRSAVMKKSTYISPLILDSIREHPGADFLEFGGGLGVFCEIVSLLGKRVTYLDIPGRSLEFATWRYQKYNLPIEIHVSDPRQTGLVKDYDIIFSEAVIEHLIDPGATVDLLCKHIRQDGLFILLVDVTGHSEKFPMHRDIDIRELHSRISANGFRNVHGKDRFCSIWKKA